MDKLTLTTKNVSIEFPGVKALTNVDFEISTGEIRAVVGANGAGKCEGVAPDTYGNLSYLSVADWMPADLIH